MAVARAAAERDGQRIEVVDELRQQARIHRWQAGRLEAAAERIRRFGLAEIAAAVAAGTGVGAAGQTVSA